MISVTLISETRAKRKYNVKELKKNNTRYFDLLISTKYRFFIYSLLNILYLLIFFIFLFLSLFIFLLLFILISERYKKEKVNKRINNIKKTFKRLKE